MQVLVDEYQNCIDVINGSIGNGCDLGFTILGGKEGEFPTMLISRFKSSSFNRANREFYHHSTNEIDAGTAKLMWTNNSQGLIKTALRARSKKGHFAFK
jgi:hypothetical protein